jgi:hypothetical protein
VEVSQAGEGDEIVYRVRLAVPEEPWAMLLLRRIVLHHSSADAAGDLLPDSGLLMHRGP